MFGDQRHRRHNVMTVSLGNWCNLGEGLPAAQERAIFQRLQLPDRELRRAKRASCCPRHQQEPLRNHLIGGHPVDPKPQSSIVARSDRQGKADQGIHVLLTILPMATGGRDGRGIHASSGIIRSSDPQVTWGQGNRLGIDGSLTNSDRSARSAEVAHFGGS